ncbi:hypothetical protein SAY87_016582 [Trapa incisa]|uniref:U-box domain-containing protein n=1 Tax=Trapa incisa TaxID=236973 RepID=A0AAN7L723_9MYRT|nr:hypothetical protein SAY87_016582 [Trapa incisa]
MNDQSASLPYKDQPAAISCHILEPKARMAESAAAHRDLASKKDPDPMADDHPDIEFKGLCLKTLKRLDELGLENERNRWCMAEAGVAEAMVPLINKFSDENSDGLEECTRIFNWTWTSGRPGLRLLVQENSDLVDSLSWILQSTNNNTAVKNSAMAALKHVVEVANVALLERLKLETFEAIVKAVSEVRNRRISTPPSIQQVSQVAAVVKCALQVLIDASPWGRNRQKIVKAGAVFELIELELEKPEQKRVSEMVFELLAQLCSCADGRERLLGHAGGIAMLAKRTLRVSPVVDDRTVQILAMVSQFSASKGVLMEILRVGAVSKLCMVMQADCSVSLKNKARSILRMHSSVWNNSPCIAVYLLTRDTDR